MYVPCEMFWDFLAFTYCFVQITAAVILQASLIPLLLPALVTFPALSMVMNITSSPFVLQLCGGNFPAFPIVPGMKAVSILSFPILVILSLLESGVTVSFSSFARIFSFLSGFDVSFFSSPMDVLPQNRIGG